MTVGLKKNKNRKDQLESYVGNQAKYSNDNENEEIDSMFRR